VLDNPDVVIPAALNRAVAATTAEIVARMDAHAQYAPDYLECIIKVLASRPDVAGAGGAMRTEGSGPWGEAIAAVLRSRWALGGAPHRIGGAGGPVDHVFCTAYRRDVVIAAGGWDAHLLANEDAELDYRVGATIGPIWLEPRAQSTWMTRTSPTALARQMWRYGFFRARTVHLHPTSLRVRHLAPVMVAGGLALGLVVRPRWGMRATALYLTAGGTVAAVTASGAGASRWRAAVALPIVHLAWGSGMLIGLVRHRGATSAPGLDSTAASAPP
jgi:hypothetical protein